MPVNSRSGRIESFDVEEQSETSALHLYIEQLSPGPLHSSIEFVQTDGLLVYRQHLNRRIHASGASPDGYVMIGTTASRKSRVDWNGLALSNRRLAFAGPATDLDFSVFEDSEPVVLLVKPQLLRRYLGEEATAEMLGAGHALECDPRFNRRLIHSAGLIIDRYLAHGELLKNKREREMVEAELIETFAEITVAEDARSGRNTKPKRSQALRRAIEYANSVNGPIPIPALAEAAGVSQRTLEYAFRETFGVTPAKYLRWSRMNRLHRAVLEGEPGSTNITTMAAKFGFSELGRLAVEYRRLFGESPSATAARKRTATNARLKDLLISS
jgi:AraC family ethanolamine operon transcriptional activator